MEFSTCSKLNSWPNFDKNCKKNATFTLYFLGFKFFECNLRNKPTKPLLRQSKSNFLCKNPATNRSIMDKNLAHYGSHFCSLHGTMTLYIHILFVSLVNVTINFIYFEINKVGRRKFELECFDNFPGIFFSGH